ncbi:TonB-dependent receptor [Larkinella terrae]|uniref:TonB-dependent receptor plug domain-containing protein n=1 Tax=Larkinella terrae TaxID=2025311 RepID=A0A7K0EUL7_9BACT|nr:TonB-dependent receptor [Larkinella terrae]MRS65211.1 TonB-dependent receptor plug domain-containing protein [Larkinella terrae]
MHLRTFILTFIAWIFLQKAVAQSYTQTIRGTVVDQSLQTALPGATIVILNSDPLRGTSTEADGSFRLNQVPVGRHSLKITSLGYKELILPNIVVDAGKELVLNVALQEAIVTVNEVTVKPQIEKEKPFNEMATVSARTFSVEETQKFAAAVNDPARMATAYAGVVGADDGGNQIVIRGNSPTGLLWRMEGVDIPNPNHFANMGSAGGGISILSAQLLANSDFMTGAFPAEYGNALSGVFDLRLRKGNNSKREHTIQAGVLGIDVASEGPFSKNYKGSYLFNYRYSTLGLLSKMGVSIGPFANIFQDLSFNVYLPAGKAGNFTLFGFGGLSNSDLDAVKDSTQWKSDGERFNDHFFAKTGAVGATHSIHLTKRAFLKSVLLFSGYQSGYENESLETGYVPQLQLREAYRIRKQIASSTLTYKFNSQHTLRVGLTGSVLGFNLERKERLPELNTMQTQIQINDQTSTVQAYGQWNYRMTEKLTFNAGMHYLRLMLNNTDAVEPRGSVRWAFVPKHAVSFGYGLHSQVQNLATYFATQPSENGSSNRNLGFTRSHHLVLAYDWSLNDHLRVKAESYYQSLFNIPISADKPNAFAMVNSFDGLTTERLTNKGVGRNYGLELTVEQFLHNNVYFLLSSSLYDSRYRGSDNIWRDTRFNGKFAFSFQGGKEWVLGESGKNVIGVNLKLTYYGGYRATPIDLAESIRKQETVFVDSQSYSQKLPDYFRTDVRFSWKRNKRHSTRTLSLDIQNATNRQNVYGQYFEPRSGTVKTSYMTPLIPVLSYRVAF